MKQQIKSFIEELKSNKKISTFDEASTEQAIVLRLLFLLERDIFNVDEVCSNYSFCSYNFYYALVVSHKNKVFTDVKSVDERLDKDQKILLGAAAREGVNLYVQTNGVARCFYLISTASK
jgi:predicted type IV restriction endonuclease